jgi:hypothetical protein
MTIDLQDHPKLFSYVMEMIATNNHNIYSSEEPTLQYGHHHSELL